MTKIVVNKEAFRLTEMELGPGSTSIGRNSDNDVHLDDKTVSGKHAKIVTLFSSSYVEDLGSTNGTFVNGNKVKTYTLRNGDVLTIGNYRILFESPQESNSQSENESTIIMDRAQIDNLLASENTKESVNKTKEFSPKPVNRTSYDKSTIRNVPLRSTTTTELPVDKQTQSLTSINPTSNSSVKSKKSYPRSKINEPYSINAPSNGKIDNESNRSSPSREIIVVILLATAIIAATLYAILR